MFRGPGAALGRVGRERRRLWQLQDVSPAAHDPPGSHLGDPVEEFTADPAGIVPHRLASTPGL